MQQAISQNFAAHDAIADRQFGSRPPDDRSTEGKTGLAPRFPDLLRVMELVQAVSQERDPEAALVERLHCMQASQQALFVLLSKQEKEDDEVLLGHQRRLMANQATYDAAKAVLRLARAWTRAL